MLSFGMNYKLHYSLFQLFILMVTFKLGPYESTDDDLSSSVSGLAVMLTMLIGFAIISDDVSDPTYDINIIAYSLLGVTAATGIFNLGMIVKVCCDERRESKRLRKIERNQKKQKKQLKQSMNKISLTTTVVPKASGETNDEEGVENEETNALLDFASWGEVVQENTPIESNDNAGETGDQRIEDILKSKTPPSSPRSRLPSLSIPTLDLSTSDIEEGNISNSGSPESSRSPESDGTPLITSLHSVNRTNLFVSKFKLPNINSTMTITILYLLFSTTNSQCTSHFAYPRSTLNFN